MRGIGLESNTLMQVKITCIEALSVNKKSNKLINKIQASNRIYTRVSFLLRTTSNKQVLNLL